MLDVVCSCGYTVDDVSILTVNKTGAFLVVKFKCPSCKKYNIHKIKL